MQKAGKNHQKAEINDNLNTLFWWLVICFPKKTTNTSKLTVKRIQFWRKIIKDFGWGLNLVLSFFGHKCTPLFNRFFYIQFGKPRLLARIALKKYKLHPTNPNPENSPHSFTRKPSKNIIIMVHWNKKHINNFSKKNSFQNYHFKKLSIIIKKESTVFQNINFEKWHETKFFSNEGER